MPVNNDMTIEETIEHLDQIAKNQLECADKIDELNCDSTSTRNMASYHKQLAEWLRELKKYRIAHWKLRDMDYEYDFNSIFGKNPMYYSEEVWNLFGDIDASVEYEVMGYEEVNADEK